MYNMYNEVLVLDAKMTLAFVNVYMWLEKQILFNIRKLYCTNSAYLFHW